MNDGTRLGNPRVADGSAERVARTLAFIDRELAELENQKPHEGTEAAVYWLVSVRHVLWGHEGTILGTYERFVEEVNGAPTEESLTTIFRTEGRWDGLPKLLGDFARWVAERWPENRL